MMHYAGRVRVLATGESHRVLLAFVSGMSFVPGSITASETSFPSRYFVYPYGNPRSRE